MLITRLLNKLVQDTQNTKKPYYSQVERACSSILQDLRLGDSEVENETKVLRQKSLEYEQSDDGEDVAANLDLLVGEEKRPQVSVDSEKFFIPFELACKGDLAKITITALDGIQKLVAYGELVGDFPDPKTPTRRLIDRIVHTICDCHVGQETDEGVELQIIKALLTIVTSEKVLVHDSTLLLILRTCYIIHLATKSSVNQRTARAMLTQMLHSIFHRMEAAAEESQFDYLGLEKEWESETLALVQQSFSHTILSVPPDLTTKHNLNNYSNKDVELQQPVSDFNQNSQRNQDRIEQEENSDHIVETITENNFSNGIGRQEEYNGVGNQVLESDYVEERTDDSLNPFLTSPKHPPPTLMSVLQKDAFLSFWTLTKLALKPFNQNEVENEQERNNPKEKFQQAILAFHLLKELLDKSGKVFKGSPIFVNVMKHHLYQALMENGISTNLDVFKLEVEIVMSLFVKFKEVLIDEIQELLDALIFPVIDGTILYTPEYKKIVLKEMKNVSHNLDSFVFLYLSCDYDAQTEERPFHKIMLCTSRIVREREPYYEIAVEIITNLLKSMSDACPKLDDTNFIETERFDTFYIHEGRLKFTDESVEALELEGKDFLICLHLFLAKFNTTCDGLKTDWLVQKLAQKMTDTSSVNSLKTETADCWYSLIYSSMSLIADIRITNCQGKSKMSKNQFLKLNRAINGCEPLDEACLSSIYDEIEVTYQKNCDEADSSDERRMFSLIEKSEDEILQVIKYILETTSLLRSHFSLGKQLKHVKRMIKICGTSFLIALISALQNTNDTKLSDVCLDGIHSGIRVACILGLDNERESYVQALAKLSSTALDEIRGKYINSKIVTTKTSTLTMTENGVTKTVVTTTTEMKCRSVDIILTLLDVGIAEGNHLGGSWLHILRFISQLLSTPLLAESRNSSRSSSPIPPAQTPGTGSGWVAWAGSLKESLEKKLWDPAVTALHPSVKESIAVSVEKVFKRSELLTGDAMTDFFQALCQVSLHDMMNSETPKHLMYEKINEVADGNFYRPALQWSQIWQVVADYFCHLACSSKEEISTLAIESIQKLVLKLLKKETLNGYRFQNHYLSPLKVIITNTRSQSTREVVLGFVETVIDLYGDLLLSGWIAILSILVANIASNNEKDAADSFKVLQHIVDKCQKGEVNLRNSFGSIVKSLIDIASNIAPTLEMSEQAFRLLTQMAEIPYRQPELLMEENDDKLYRVWSRGWKPILGEISGIVCNNGFSDYHVNSSNDNKIPSWDIKTKALITLFEVIKTYGSSFEKEWWNSVFEVLFNIFNSIKSQEKQDLMVSQLPWSSSSPSSADGNYKYFYCYYYAQFAIFDVYTQYYDAMGSYVFDELLKHLQWCICQDHEQFALSGVSCLQQLVVELGNQFGVNQWDSILNVFQTICKPPEITQNNNLGWQKNDEISASPMNQSSAILAVIQLELLKIMDKIIFISRKSSSLSLNIRKDINTTSETDVPTSSTSDAPTEKINDILTTSQVSLILQILNRSHEITKENCIMADLALTDVSSEKKLDSPNFIPHETLSLQIYWKLVFAMFKTDFSYEISKDDLWEMIQQSCIRSCGYFVTIQSRDHRDAWADLLCFTLDKILALPTAMFETLTFHLYPYVCEMLEVDLDIKICAKLREYLLKLGGDYQISLSNSSEKSALGSEFDLVPKITNGIISHSFQRTCLTESLNDTYINQSKDFL